ncbi:hypothetical protein AGMMS50212_04110 [Spirochaetia bacterium]|nr:hypothetical protein AGMMS50212_04110 [Spirochaetia bacterium]
MADNKNIYNPGELEKVKGKLGDINEKEAKRMQKLLGGEVGYEKSEYELKAAAEKTAAAAALPKKPKRVVETAPVESEYGMSANKAPPPKLPRVSVLSYSERVKMDVCAADSEFGIKTAWQVFISKLSFFSRPQDYVSRWFVRDRMNEYYSQIENLVTSVRLLYPRNSLERTSRLKKVSPFAHNILNTLRQCKLEVISREIGGLQSHPRNVLVKDFVVILREIYKPIYILDLLDIDTHISDAFNLLYKQIYIDNPSTETEKLLQNISEALASWQYISIKIRRYLYPLLMKNLSSYYEDYEYFFQENEEKIASFLGVTKEEQLKPPAPKMEIDQKSPLNESEDTENDKTDLDDQQDKEKEEDEEEEKDETPKINTAEDKALARGLKVLESLFPKAGWNNIADFPDFYPYFSDVLDLKKNSEFIAPEDPTQLTLVLCAIIEELLYGFRGVKFTKTNEKNLGTFIDDWHDTAVESFERLYLPRISEYSHFFEHAGQNKNSTYALNIATDIHWIRRYYFFPYYEYKSPTPPSFQKKDVVSLYPIVRKLRMELTSIAAEIETANKLGGAATMQTIDSIENPWDDYEFEVENPLSKRLDMLLVKTQKTNVSLIFFTLAIVTVLDNLLNNKDSIAYKNPSPKLFRSSDAAGLVPIFWVEKSTNTFALFKQSLARTKPKS